MKKIVLYSLFIIACYVIPLGTLASCNRAEASTTQIPEDEKRIILQYETRISGVRYQILEIDGYDYIAQENGCVTRLKP